MPGSPWYPLLSGVAFVVSTVVVARLLGDTARGPAGGKLAVIWLSAVVGAFLGAMLAFQFAEAWFHFHLGMRAILGGRSITGALAGGYVGVEIAKRCVGWTQPTGDVFAVTVPLALAIGRIGCVLAGCCQGVECDDAWFAVHDVHGHARWPAAQLELLFNATFLLWALAATRFGWQRDQRFHVYLMAYGLFRFAHEFLRDDPRWFGPISGYHVLALLLVALGVWGYQVRRRGVRGQGPGFSERHRANAPRERTPNPEP